MIAPHENLLTVADVAKAYRIPGRTQRYWRANDPSFRETVLKVGGWRVFYDRRALELWLESQRETRVQK